MPESIQTPEKTELKIWLNLGYGGERQERQGKDSNGHQSIQRE